MFASMRQPKYRMTFYLGLKQRYGQRRAPRLCVIELLNWFFITVLTLLDHAIQLALFAVLVEAIERA